jgi:hypothetical protein
MAKRLTKKYTDTDREVWRIQQQHRRNLKRASYRHASIAYRHDKLLKHLKATGLIGPDWDLTPKEAAVWIQFLFDRMLSPKDSDG